MSKRRRPDKRDGPSSRVIGAVITVVVIFAAMFFVVRPLMQSILLRGITP